MPRPHRHAARDERAGILFGFAAYFLWGLFPLFFLLLDAVGAVETVAHRIVWTMIAVLAALAVTRNLAGLAAIVRDRRRFLLVTGAAVLIAINWVVFIYAVNSDHVIEGSLGYFITPLVSAAFGVLVFRERLRPQQVLAFGLGLCAVLVLTFDYGRLPWIALTLGLSFGTYGLVKKLADVGAAESLALETIVLLLPALGVVLGFGLSGGSAFGGSLDLTVLLIASGPLTAVPLLLFAASITRTRLTVMAMLQYLTPVLQFLVGLLLLGEPMPASRWIGFVLVWTALVLLSADVVRNARRTRVLEPALERA